MDMQPRKPLPEGWRVHRGGGREKAVEKPTTESWRLKALGCLLRAFPSPIMLIIGGIGLLLLMVPTVLVCLLGPYRLALYIDGVLTGMCNYLSRVAYSGEV